jgi:predicted house-cleaning noncanonical NTP pyrophosphatase (MazG superfamily)
MSRYNSVKEFQGGRADRQERTNYLDNKLHEEIKKFKESN